MKNFIFKAIVVLIFSNLFALKVLSQTNDTLVRIKVQRSTYSDECIFRIDHRATDNFDGAYDANKMLSSNPAHPQIWNVTPLIENLSMNSFPFYTSFKSFPIGFKTTVADSITMQAYAYSKIDSNIRIYIHDLILDSIIDMRNVTSYKFYSLAVNNATRFKAYFAGETTYSGDTLNYGFPDSLIALKVKDGLLEIDNLNLKAYNVIIEPEASLTLNDNSTLNVKNYFKIKSDANSTGSFIENGLTTVKNGFIVEKYLADLTVSGWNISSAISDATTDVFNGADGIWHFNVLTAQWESVTPGGLINAKGYVVRYLGQNKTLSFSGTQNNDEIKATLFRTEDFGGNFGWNLIGNPYPSAIDWDIVRQGNISDINDAIYFRRLDGGIDSYVDGIGVNDGTSIIPAMQAFWVQVQLTSEVGSVTFNNSARLHSSQQQYKKYNYVSDVISIKLSDDLISDETVIRFKDNAGFEFDKSHDAYKMYSDNPSHHQIFSLTPSMESLVVNTVPNSVNTFKIPLGIFSPNITSLNLKFNLFDVQDYAIFLEDVYLNEFYHVTDNFNLAFNTVQGFCNECFILHIIPQSNAIQDIKKEHVEVYYFNNTLFVTGDNISESTEYMIFNTLGQCIKTGRFSGYQSTYALPLDAEIGMYYISIYNSGLGNSLNTKFLVR